MIQGSKVSHVPTSATLVAKMGVSRISRSATTCSKYGGWAYYQEITVIVIQFCNYVIGAASIPVEEPNQPYRPYMIICAVLHLLAAINYGMSISLSHSLSLHAEKW